MEKICEICGCSYKPYPGTFETAKCCSKKCHMKRMRKIMKEKDAYYRGPHEWSKGNKHRKGIKPTYSFANQDISREKHPRWKARLKFTCKNCGNEFERERWRLKDPSRTNEYCSIKCRGEYKTKFLSGENAPDYVGGPQTYRGKGWTKARIAVIEQQNGECARCGKHIGKSLSVHHIKPFREFKSVAEANNLDNLIGLCQSCHMKEERPTKRPLISVNQTA